MTTNLIEELSDNGYTDFRTFQTGELSALLKLSFTTGLFVGLNEYSYRIRYCYATRQQAYDALMAWDGSGDPPGPWIKAKGAGMDRGNLSMALSQ